MSSHDQFRDVIAKTAKCDSCELRNTTVIRACIKCSLNMCISCWLSFGNDGVHRINPGGPEWRTRTAVESVQPELAQAASPNTKGQLADNRDDENHVDSTINAVPSNVRTPGSANNDWTDSDEEMESDGDYEEDLSLPSGDENAAQPFRLLLQAAELILQNEENAGRNGQNDGASELSRSNSAQQFSTVSEMKAELSHLDTPGREVNFGPLINGVRYYHVPQGDSMEILADRFGGTSFFLDRNELIEQETLYIAQRRGAEVVIAMMPRPEWYRNANPEPPKGNGWPFPNERELERLRQCLEQREGSGLFVPGYSMDVDQSAPAPEIDRAITGAEDSTSSISTSPIARQGDNAISNRYNSIIEIDPSQVVATPPAGNRLHHPQGATESDNLEPQTPQAVQTQPALMRNDTGSELIRGANAINGSAHSVSRQPQVLLYAPQPRPGVVHGVLRTNRDANRAVFSPYPARLINSPVSSHTASTRGASTSSRFRLMTSPLRESTVGYQQVQGSNLPGPMTDRAGATHESTRDSFWRQQMRLNAQGNAPAPQYTQGGINAVHWNRLDVPSGATSSSLIQSMNNNSPAQRGIANGLRTRTIPGSIRSSSAANSALDGTHPVRMTGIQVRGEGNLRFHTPSAQEENRTRPAQRIGDMTRFFTPPPPEGAVFNNAFSPNASSLSRAASPSDSTMVSPSVAASSPRSEASVTLAQASGMPQEPRGAQGHLGRHGSQRLQRAQAPGELQLSHTSRAPSLRRPMAVTAPASGTRLPIEAIPRMITHRRIQTLREDDSRPADVYMGGYIRPTPALESDDAVYPPHPYPSFAQVVNGNRASQNNRNNGILGRNSTAQRPGANYEQSYREHQQQTPTAGSERGEQPFVPRGGYIRSATPEEVLVQVVGNTEQWYRVRGAPGAGTVFEAVDTDEATASMAAARESVQTVPTEAADTAATQPQASATTRAMTRTRSGSRYSFFSDRAGMD